MKASWISSTWTSSAHHIAASSAWWSNVIMPCVHVESILRSFETCCSKDELVVWEGWPWNINCPANHLFFWFCWYVQCHSNLFSMKRDNRPKMSNNSNVSDAASASWKAAPDVFINFECSTLGGNLMCLCIHTQWLSLQQDVCRMFAIAFCLFVLLIAMLEQSTHIPGVPRPQCCLAVEHSFDCQDID